MRAYVGVTDGDWYRHLAARSDLREANFWRPSATGVFRSLSIGEPFLFKSHSPHNRLIGGGIFSGYAVLRASEAWEFFGEANGSDSFDGMLKRIGRYRRGAPTDADPDIGCVFVRDTIFFPADADEASPKDFSLNIVQGKGYDLAELEQDHPVARAALRVLAHESDTLGPQRVDGPTRGAPVLTVPRLGQGSFKALVLTSYGRRCAITGDKITPVLQAAHIIFSDYQFG